MLNNNNNNNNNNDNNNDNDNYKIFLTHLCYANMIESSLVIG